MATKLQHLNLIEQQLLLYLIMKKSIFKNDTTNGSEMEKVQNFPKYYKNKGSVNIDDGSMGGTHWTCF